VDLEELFIKLLFGVIVVIVVSVSSCTMHANHESAKLLKAGIDGRHVKCAIASGTGDSGLICSSVES
jgi:hypothetical protein